MEELAKQASSSCSYGKWGARTFGDERGGAAYMVAGFCPLACVTPGHGEEGFSVVSGGRSMWLPLIRYSSRPP
jgi:hypothetical protein